MNIKYINRKALQAVALFFGLALTACSSDEGTGSTATPQVVNITFTQPSGNGKATSRVGYDSEGAGYWHPGDVLSVLYFDMKETKSSQFSLVSGAGTSTATFTGLMDYGINAAQCVAAVYPYNENYTATTYNLPASYSYDGVDRDYTYTSESKSVNMPMLSFLKFYGHKFQPNFRLIGAVLAIKVDHLPAATGTVTVTANEYIAGNTRYGVENDDSGDPKIDSISGQMVTYLEALEEGEKTVTFSYTNATPVQAGVFYLPLPPGSYTGVKITIAGGDVTYTAGGESGKSLTLERGHIKKLKVATTYEIAAEGH